LDNLSQDNNKRAALNGHDIPGYRDHFLVPKKKAQECKSDSQGSSQQPRQITVQTLGDLLNTHSGRFAAALLRVSALLTTLTLFRPDIRVRRL